MAQGAKDLKALLERKPEERFYVFWLNCGVLDDTNFVWRALFHGTRVPVALG